MASAGVLREPKPLPFDLADDPDDGEEALDLHAYDSRFFRVSLAARFAELEQFVSDEFQRLENRQDVLCRSGRKATTAESASPSKWRGGCTWSFPELEPDFPGLSNPSPSSLEGGLHQHHLSPDRVARVESADGKDVSLDKACGSVGSVMNDNFSVALPGEEDSAYGASARSRRSKRGRCSFAQRDEEFHVESLFSDGNREEALREESVRRYMRRSQRVSEVMSRSYKAAFNLDWVASSADHPAPDVKRHWFWRCCFMAGSPEKQNNALDTFMGFVIVLNCAVIGISIDVEAGWSGWNDIDAAFATLFFFEVVMKMKIHGLVHYIFGDKWRWHIFEILLMIFAWFEVYLNYDSHSEEPDERIGVGGSNGVANALRFARTSVMSSKERAEMFLAEAAKLEIMPDFFEELLKRGDVMEILRDLDISDEDSMTLFETLDVDDSGTIDVEELFDGISKLRGDARRSDVIRVTFMLKKLQGDLKDFVQSWEAFKHAPKGGNMHLSAMARHTGAH